MFRFENAWLFIVSITFVMMLWLVPNAVYERLNLSYRTKYVISMLHPVLTAFAAIYLTLFMFGLLPYKDRLISRMHVGMYGAEHGACVGNENVFWRLHPQKGTETAE